MGFYRYWGQDAQGASNPNYTVDYQKTLSYYCNVSRFFYLVPCAMYRKTETRSGLTQFLFFVSLTGPPFKFRWFVSPLRCLRLQTCAGQFNEHRSNRILEKVLL